MTTYGLSDIYESAEQGAPIGQPDGNYDMEVTDARPRAESRLIFVDYVILNGPSAGKSVSANLYIPAADNSGAGFHFRKKINGFLNPNVKAAFMLADSAGSFEDALDIIADALIGTRINANITLVKEGTYKGNNELQDSSPLEVAQTTAPVDPVTTTSTQVAPTHTPEGNGQVAPVKTEVAF